MTQQNNIQEFSLFTNNVENIIVDCVSPPLPFYSKECIDINEIAKKEKIDNVDIISAIIDLGVSPKKYNYKSKENTKKSFWLKTKNYEILYKIFYGLSPDTLTEVWKRIQHCGDIDNFYLICKVNEETINKEYSDFKIIIKAICSYVISKRDTNFHQFFQDFVIKNLSRKKGKKSVKLLRNKRKRLEKS